MTVLFQGNFKEQIEKLVRWLLSVGFEKKSCILKKQCTQHMMTVLFQSDFKEQIEKLVRWLLCTTKNC
jgi:hypothetical protein